MCKRRKTREAGWDTEQDEAEAGENQSEEDPGCGRTGIWKAKGPTGLWFLSLDTCEN